MKNEARRLPNKHDTRESWLRSATELLRTHFSEHGFVIPDKMRFAIAFPSTGRSGKRVGELWHPATSADKSYELFIRADVDDPATVLGILVHELVHAVLPIEAGHGKAYKDAALKLGLTGKMRHAMPGPMLQARLIEVAESLGPLPHARLDIVRGATNKGPADRPKKQKGRLLKATCADASCGYTVRVTGKWVVDLGPPHCPKHGAMAMDEPPNVVEEAADDVAGKPERERVAESV